MGFLPDNTLLAVTGSQWIAHMSHLSFALEQHKSSPQAHTLSFSLVVPCYWGSPSPEKNLSHGKYNRVEKGISEKAEKTFTGEVKLKNILFISMET